MHPPKNSIEKLSYCWAVEQVVDGQRSQKAARNLQNVLLFSVLLSLDAPAIGGAGMPPHGVGTATGSWRQPHRRAVPFQQELRIVIKAAGLGSRRGCRGGILPRFGCRCRWLFIILLRRYHCWSRDMAVFQRLRR